jgi:hypothetical protein
MQNGQSPEEEHVLFNLGNIGFLHANQGVLEPDRIAHLVKKLFGTLFHN